jgi:hypothetical protein
MPHQRKALNTALPELTPPTTLTHTTLHLLRAACPQRPPPTALEQVLQLVAPQRVPSGHHVAAQHARHQRRRLGSVGVVPVHRVQLAGLAAGGHGGLGAADVRDGALRELGHVRPQRLLPACSGGGGASEG